MPRGFHPRKQGDVGEAAAIAWLTRLGGAVPLPLFHSPNYDLIADLDGRLLRVQVKTSTCHVGPDRFAVQLATNGGNQSWTGVAREFDPSHIDFLFVLVGDGRQWFIPAGEIQGRIRIKVGGDRYSEFLVASSDPLDPPSGSPSRLTAGRGGAGVGEPGRSVKSVPQLLSGFDSHPPHSPPSGGESASEVDRAEAVGRTRMSAHHQVTVPVAVATASAISPGDRFRVESRGPGSFVMTRIEEFLEEHLDQLALPDSS